MDLLNPASWGPWMMAIFAGAMMFAGGKGLKGFSNRIVMLIAMSGFWFSLAAAPLPNYGTVGSKGFELFAALINAIFGAVSILFNAVISQF